MNKELEEWMEKELKSKDMKKFNRKSKHAEYLENRIKEIHDKIFEKVLKYGNVCRIDTKLFLKYNEKLKNIKK